MKELFHISSDIPANPEQQVLSLQIGENHCCFAMTDLSGKTLYQLAYYTTDETDESFLNNLFIVHPELNNSFYKVLISYDHPQSVLIPFLYYKYEDARLLLNVMNDINENSEVISEAIPEWQIYNAFVVPRAIYEWLNRKFPGAVFRHIYTLGIKNISDAGTQGRVQVDIRTEDFILIAARENKLLLAQTFLYSTYADVIYYLLKTCQQFSLLQTDVKLVLSGLIDKESPLYKELYQFFLNLEFSEAVWNFSGDNEYPAHFFTSLNNLARCVS